MPESFDAHVSLTINASRAQVWAALVDPDAIKQYMPVTDVVSEWREESTIIWTSEFQGKPFEVRGTILRLEPERLLEYNHSLPIFRSSEASRSLENHRRVTIELTDEGAQTRLMVIERDNKTEREFAHSQGSWRMLLHGMKALLEGTSVVQRSRPGGAP